MANETLASVFRPCLGACASAPMGPVFQNVEPFTRPVCSVILMRVRHRWAQIIELMLGQRFCSSHHDYLQHW
jgi:hypothetical protein